MTAQEYERFVAAHCLRAFGARGVHVFTHVFLGRTRWGRRRIVDVLLVCGARALALECKRQNVEGSTEEKLEFALADANAAPVTSLVVYGGDGFSDACSALLAAAPGAVLCDVGATRELDVAIGCAFGFYDVVTAGARELLPEDL